MENIVVSRIRSVKFAELQSYKNITILPLIAPEGSFAYRALSEALATSDIVITEVSAIGNVPELLVINHGKTPVLLVDGEELVGAKQNRVLNTSILVEDLSETRVPVSCTEQGRWAYATPSFGESGNVMAQKLRAMKSRSVSHSLEAAASYHSDQSEVWNEIAGLQAKACCHSATSAMNDVFKSREADLHRCEEIFHCQPGQVGLFAFTDNRPAGFDLLSLSSAYNRIHSKLVRSYALESLLASTGPEVTVRDQAAAIGMAEEFFNRITACSERRFPSVGCGHDTRYRGDALAGAALVYADEVIHAAFFQIDTPGQTHGLDIISLKNRRRYYRE
jgi:hypothetical protein